MSFTLSNVFSRAFSGLGKGFVPLLVITALIYILPNQLIYWGLRLGVGVTLGAAQAFQGNMAVSLAVMLVTYFFLFMHMGAAYEVCILTQAGKPVKVGEVLAHSVGNAFPIFLICVLCALGWFVCGLLFLIPAFIFGTFFSLVVPAYVAEKPGIFGAFSRSRALTKGHRWGIFGLWALITVIFYILMMVIELPILTPIFKASVDTLHTGHRVDPPVPSFLTMAIMAVLFSLLWVVVLSINAGVYTCLRAEKDRLSSGAVEKIFE